MKQVLIEEPFKVRVRQDAEVPTPKVGEALLQVMYCGICGADLASYTGNQPFTTYPRVPGHEFSARIVDIPEMTRASSPVISSPATPTSTAASATPAVEVS